MATPSIFVSHGAPTLYLEAQPTRDFLMGLGRELPRLRAVVCVSAHWTTAAPTVGTTPDPETIHDFYGFPDALYDVRYPAPGAPALAGRVRELFDAAGLACDSDPRRGLDHGAWVPLGLMYPEAEIPIVQLSVQPGLSSAHHLAMGRALAPLRDEGVLLLASGSATHNLRDVRWVSPETPPPDYVASFHDWLARVVLAGQTEALVAYLDQAPYARENHPTPEHYLPLLVACGMGGRARLLHDGYTFGVLSMEAFAWE